ncbi:MAG: dihydroorotase [Candidatus Latescibacteria bacterium]|nr:dihydroorotase [Candidatus Latescibacterota bacterium]
MPNILLKNGRIIDPANNRDEIADLLVQNDKIVQIAPNITVPDAQVLDVSGKLVTPGLIDMHVHLRDPGFPEKETIQTGCQSAAAGGFTSVACLPNTNPTVDTPETVHYILDQAKSADARIYPIACATEKMQGEKLTDTDALLKAGAIGFSDDGLPIESETLMRDLLERAAVNGFAVYPHSEVFELTRGGHMHEGSVSKELGIKGMPAEGEAAMNERDIELVRQTGGRLHILHLSVKRAVDLVRQAKQDGLPVTAEASPHHIALTDEDVRIYGTAGKMSPPLRAKEDQDAVIAGLQDGTIDALATDHAPHTNEEKLRAFTESPNGILGFETAVGILFTKLVHTHTLSLNDTLAKLTIEPARILGIEGGTLSIGKAADITIIDPDQEWVVDANQFKSKSPNTPFHGWTLKGRATTTILSGRITHQI